MGAISIPRSLEIRLPALIGWEVVKSGGGERSQINNQIFDMECSNCSSTRKTKVYPGGLFQKDETNLLNRMDSRQSLFLSVCVGLSLTVPELIDQIVFSLSV